MRTSCGNSYCCQNRCIKCESNFVEEEGQCCAECAPLECANCRNDVDRVVRMYTRLPVTPADYAEHGYCSKCDEVNSVFSDGLCFIHTSVRSKYGKFLICKDCVGKVPNICRTCDKETDYLTIRGECASCAYSGDWIEDGNRAMRTGVCVECQSPGRALSTAGVCKRCHAVNEMKNNRLWLSSVTACEGCGDFIRTGHKYCKSCQKRLRDCADCGEEFKQSYNEILCLACSPICLGCDKPFAAMRRTDVFCQSCSTRVRMGRCTSCGDRASLDERGRCGKQECESIHSWNVYICSFCGEEEVDVPGMLCKNCVAGNHTCPSCQEREISNADYLCKECL